ncbi:hypothetical protein [Anaerococcus sp.]|uniref:hypothetical protein n=1 Tax=Anaerococcus sp. TaxID=1872515 RepID=UPI0027BA8A51|nr:hypothetical protein [Anaerococcus sp.]
MIKKKILAIIFTINFAFLAIVPGFNNISPVSISYAAEDDITIQRQQLQEGVNDSKNIFSSKAYGIINKESLKKEYNQALEYAKSVLNNNNASYEELRNATIGLNNAKNNLKEYGKKVLAVQELKYTIEEQKITIKAIEYLMNEHPAIARTIGDKANDLLSRSNDIIARAESIISQFE